MRARPHVLSWIRKQRLKKENGNWSRQNRAILIELRELKSSQDPSLRSG